MVALNLGPSRRLAWLLAGVHLGAGLLLIPLDVPGYLKLAGALALASSGVHHLRRDALRTSSGAAVRIELARDLTGTMETRGGDRLEGVLAGSSFASPAFATLVFRVEGRRAPLATVVFPDGTGAEEFRALRVALRWGRATGPG